MPIANPKLENFKLETEFRDGYVVHATHRWDLSTRVWTGEEWKQERRIGVGMSGEVWLESRTDGKLRAVKKLSQRPTVGYHHLFLKFFGWYENDDHIFLAMEYIEHGNLSEYINGSPEAKLEAKEITYQILEGIEILHGKGICHRDLKPENVLIASIHPIWVKVADFGVSKRTKNTLLRTRYGTEGYIAPELLGALPQRRWSTAPATFTYALDIWSLGCLLHEILTSSKPFFDTGDGEPGISFESGMVESWPPAINMDTLFAYCAGDIGFPTQALQESQVGEEGIAFVKSLLVPNPEDRPSATRALQDTWLQVITNDWFENLKDEFSCLGLDLDFGGKENMLKRQVGKVDILRFLPTLEKQNVPSLLLEAAVKGYNSVISRLLESSSWNLGSVDNRKLFRLAAGAGRLDTIKVLLDHKLDVNATAADCEGQTALQAAAERGYIDIVKLLLENKVNMNGSTAEVGDRTALKTAAECGHIDIVRLFVENKVSVNALAAEVGGRTALQAAAGSGNISIVKLLLDNGADVNAEAVEDEGRTALQAAAEDGHLGIVQLLLENGANVNTPATEASGRTALQASAEGGHIEIVKLLLDNGAEVNAEAAKWNGRTALQAAAEGGHTSAVSLLLNNNADVNAQVTEYYKGRTTLQAAAEGGHIEVVKLLLEHKVNVNALAADVGGRTALQAAAGGGHINIVKLLLGNGAEVNAEAVEDEGRTALQAAAEGGYIDIIKLLLESKANVNALAAAIRGRTALQAAAEGGHIEITKLLLDNKAYINGRQSRKGGRTALQAAAEHGHIEIAQLLLNKNADVNGRKSRRGGRTALQAAAGGGHTEIVKLLLDNKADVSDRKRIRGGQTALRLAVQGGHIEIVKLLLKSGADINAKCGGFATLSVAKSSGNQDLMRIIKEALDSALV